MTNYVIDTHALFWYLTGSTKLSSAAKQAFDAGANGQAMLLVPVIVLAELYYLIEKVKSPLKLVDVHRTLTDAGQFRIVPLHADDLLDFETDAAVGEMHDRIIAGAARRAGAACVTRDADIAAAGVVATVW